jgi:hypothetical protein
MGLSTTNNHEDIRQNRCSLNELTKRIAAHQILAGQLDDVSCDLRSELDVVYGNENRGDG